MHDTASLQSSQVGVEEEQFAVQWVLRFKSGQDKSVPDLRATESACPAYTKSYIFPITYRSDV